MRVQAIQNAASSDTNIAITKAMWANYSGMFANLRKLNPANRMTFVDSLLPLNLKSCTPFKSTHIVEEE